MMMMIYNNNQDEDSNHGHHRQAVVFPLCMNGECSGVEGVGRWSALALEGDGLRAGSRTHILELFRQQLAQTLSDGVLTAAQSQPVHLRNGKTHTRTHTVFINSESTHQHALPPCLSTPDIKPSAVTGN